MLFAAALVGGCGGGSETEAAKKKLEDACNAICEKGYTPECAGLTADQCKASCPQLENVLEQQYGGACLTEYADFYSCASTLEYQCTENGPQPIGGSGCYQETVNLQKCIQTAPCENYCTTKSECDGSDANACQTECNAKLNEDGGSCDYEYENLIECQGGNGTTCEGKKLKTVGCDEDIASYASCLSSGDTCTGYCWGVVTVGCGSQSEAQCKTACSADVGAAESKGCSSQLAYLQQCQLGHGLPCNDDGTVSIVGCSEEAWQYQSCMEGN